MPKKDKKKEPIKKKLEIKKPEKVGCPTCGRIDGLKSQGRCVICIHCGFGTCDI